MNQAPAVRRARAELERAQARAAEQQRKAAAKKGPGPVRNITDRDSRLMPVRGGGFIQGYNAQNVTSADGLIIATQLTADTTDMAWFGPMLTAALDAAALITARQPPQAASPADAPGQDATDRAGSPHQAVPRRRRVLLRGQPHPARPGPADRHRQAPRPRKTGPRRR